MSNKNQVVAIVAIAFLGILSIWKGLDGQIIMLSMVAIAGLGGYEVYTQTKNTQG